jgi:hypothetical protein
MEIEQIQEFVASKEEGRVAVTKDQNDGDVVEVSRKQFDVNTGQPVDPKVTRLVRRELRDYKSRLNAEIARLRALKQDVISVLAEFAPDEESANDSKG